MSASAMDVGPIGIWTAQFDRVFDAAGELEQLGFSAIWFPESVGREALTNAALLLGATRARVKNRRGSGLEPVIISRELLL